MFYSYVMGIDESIFNLKKLGFKIEQDGDDYQVTFPDDKAITWENFIKSHLKQGFWNEYLATDKVVFIFHLENGFKRYEVIQYNNTEVLNLCEKLCQCKFISIKQMLLDNHFYKDIIK